MYGTEPDCQLCFGDDLWPENVEAFKVFQACKYELVAGNKGPICGKFTPVYLAMDMYQVEDKERCYALVCLAVDSYITYMRSKG
jgi:hypothetical protein